MRNKIFALAPALFLAVGCSSIVSKSDYPVAISSSPGGAEFLITNKAGQKVHSGRTPATVTLKSSAGFFRPASYTISVTKPGFDTATATVNSSIDGWYFGNLILGGVLGMLVIDPLTGAMWNLPERTDISLASSRSGDLNISTLQNLSGEERSRLVSINEKAAKQSAQDEQLQSKPYRSSGSMSRAAEQYEEERRLYHERNRN